MAIARFPLPIAAALVLVMGLPVAHGQEARTVRMSGLFLGSWSMDLGPEAASNNRFEVNRAYLTFSGALSERVSGRITTDAIREDGEELEVRLKYAYAAYRRPGAPITIRFGMTHTPFLEYEEALWEHRMQGSVPADRLKFMTTSDIGVSADGAWGPGDKLQVAAGVYNGETWSAGEGDSGKDVMARATVRLAASDDGGPYGGLRLTGYGQVGSPVGGGVRRRGLAMLSWRSRQLTLATQFLSTRDRSDAGTGVAGPVKDGRLFNSFAVAKVPGTTVVAILRLEQFDPNRQVMGDNQTRWTGGVGFRLAPELRVLGAVEHLRYEAGAPTPALDASRVRALMHVALTF